MIYNICLLAVWTAFLWKNLTPRFSFRVTMLICAVVVPAVVLGVNYGLNRLSVLRLISVPLLFLILGLTLYRSPIPLTAFVALLPEATLLMMEMMLSVVFPMLFGLNGEVDYWHTAAAEPLALLTVSLYAGTLALATWALSRNGRPLSLTQWLIFAVFPLQQSACLITMFRLYAQFPEAVNWPRMSVLILLFAVSDVALFCLIGQTARKAELETANRLLNDQLDNQLKHYSALVDQYEDNRRIRHDIAHHMHTIQLLLESGRRQEATAYAGELMRQQEHSPQLDQCENPLVDAFLFSRIREARQAGIPVEASVVLPRRLPIANVDLVILFGNLMDNAVEACGQVASPFIRLEAGLRKDYLVVTETNPDALQNIRITLFKNNQTIILQEGTDYRIEVRGGNGQWYEYIYTVLAKNFADDGVYRLTFYSEDAAGNIAENTLDTKKQEIGFGVDKTKPNMVVTNLESDTTYPLENLTVSLSAGDNLLLQSVVVYLDDYSKAYKTWRPR